MKIGCVVLAGGLARRMGGGDKGLKTVQGQRILDRVLSVVAPQVDALVLNANGDKSRFDEFGYPVVSDSIDGFVGPLAGILAGMDALGDCDYILSAPTDTPFLPNDLVSRLKTAVLEGGLDIAIARSGGFDHPVIGLWSTRLREDLRKVLVEEEVRKLKIWISRYKWDRVEWAIDDQDPFFNANSPDDLAQLS